MAVIWGTPMPAMTRVVQIEPGPMPDLDGVGAGVDEGECRLGRGDVAGDDVDLEVRPHLGHRVEDAAGVPVGGVHDDDVDAGGHERLHALEGVGAGADGGGHPQPAAGRPWSPFG